MIYALSRPASEKASDRWGNFYFERGFIMQVKCMKRMWPLLAVIFCFLVSTGSASANCTNGAVIAHGLTSSFEQCGPNAVVFAWFHGRGVQRNVGAEDTNNTGQQASGDDTGRRQIITDGGGDNGPNGGPA